MQGAAEGLTSRSFPGRGGWEGLVSRAVIWSPFSMDFDRYLSTSEDGVQGTGHKV